MGKATNKQTFALFLGTGKCLELRQMNLDFDIASELVGRMKAGHVDEVRQRLIDLGAVVKGEAVYQKPKKDWQAVYDEAHAAGMAAGTAHVPTPMIVTEHLDPLNDSSEIVRQYAPVMGGVCGFAYIKFPGNSSWARWATKKKLTMDDYPTGKMISVHYFNQSMECKYAYAVAFANVLQKHGIERVYAYDRMD